MAVCMAQSGWLWVWASQVPESRRGWYITGWAGEPVSECVFQVYTQWSQKGKKMTKISFYACQQGDLFCWRGEVSQDSTRFRPKVVWAWLGASNPRHFVFYKEGIDGCCFLSRRKDSSNKTQNKTSNFLKTESALYADCFCFVFLSFLHLLWKKMVQWEVWQAASLELWAPSASASLLGLWDTLPVTGPRGRATASSLCTQSRTPLMGNFARENLGEVTDNIKSSTEAALLCRNQGLIGKTLYLCTQFYVLGFYI